MPQPFKNAVMTNKGAELLTKAQAGLVKLEFTRIVTGSGSYQENEKTMDALWSATGLKEEKQSFAPSSISVYSPKSVSIKALITNDPADGQELAEGYYINEMGLFAKEKDGEDSTEVLYSISVTAGPQGDFMPPYNGYSPAEIIQEYYATVSNSAEVTIVRGMGAVALAEDLEAVKPLAGYYYNERGSITDGSFYEDSGHTIEMEKKDGSLYIDRISRRLYWCEVDKYRLISPTDTPDWDAASGSLGYIANKPEISGRNAIRVIMNGNFTLTLDDPQANIIGMGAAYFKNGLDFNIISVTISGTTATQVQNNGSGKPVRIYVQAGVTTTTPGKKTIYIYTYNGSSSTLLATGQIYAPVAGTYTVATSTNTTLIAAGYVYIKISGATGDVITNQNNLTFLTVDEI